eukprot:evm.model.scf_2405.1 EVM.evm.TU.scf_2405.1   scf_2405:7775-14270(-)
MPLGRGDMELVWMVAALLSALLFAGADGAEASITNTCQARSRLVGSQELLLAAEGCAGSGAEAGCCEKVQETFGGRGALAYCLCDNYYYSQFLMEVPAKLGIPPDDYLQMLLECRIPVVGRLECPGTTEEFDAEPLVLEQGPLQDFLNGIAASEGSAQGSGAPGEDGSCTTAKWVIDGDAELSTFSKLLKATTANISLDIPELEVTIFAPTDSAFKKLADDVRTTIDNFTDPMYTEVVDEILKMHIVPDVAAQSRRLFDRHVFRTLHGADGEIRVRVDDGGIEIESPGGNKARPARVVQADIPACSALIHKIDRVLIPRADILSG